MKIICQKDILNYALNKVSRAVFKSSTNTNAIKLFAQDNELVLTGNNLEVEIISFLKCEVISEGEVVLNAKIFCDIVKSLPAKEVFIEVFENFQTKVHCLNAKFEIIGQDPKGFPKSNEFDFTNLIKISKNNFKQMILGAIFSVSIDSNKPVLSGCLFEICLKSVNLVAVDGFRMAIRSTKTDKKNIEQSMIIPSKVLSEVSRILKDEDDFININYSNNYISFSFDNCKIISKLIEGKYIDYKRIIPKENIYIFKFDVKNLIKSIERAAIVVTSDTNRVPIIFLIKDNVLKISCKNVLGSSEDSIEIDSGDFELEIGFNHKFLIDALKSCASKEVNLSFGQNVTPLVITPANNDDFCYIILPVRLKSS